METAIYCLLFIINVAGMLLFFVRLQAAELSITLLQKRIEHLESTKNSFLDTHYGTHNGMGAI